MVRLGQILKIIILYRFLAVDASASDSDDMLVLIYKYIYMEIGWKTNKKSSNQKHFKNLEIISLELLFAQGFIKSVN